MRTRTQMDALEDCGCESIESKRPSRKIPFDSATRLVRAYMHMYIHIRYTWTYAVARTRTVSKNSSRLYKYDVSICAPRSNPSRNGQRVFHDSREILNLSLAYTSLHLFTVSYVCNDAFKLDPSRGIVEAQTFSADSKHAGSTKHVER